MVAVPAATPVTMPVVPTAAIPVAELLQTPLCIASLSEVVAPAVTMAVPFIVPETGNAFTVTTRVAASEPTV